MGVIIQFCLATLGAYPLCPSLVAALHMFLRHGQSIVAVQT